MKESLFEFSKSHHDDNGPKDKEKSDFSENINKNQNEEAKIIFDKYKNYSKDELLTEFLSSTRKRLSDGSLSREKFNSTINAILPFLDENGKETLRELVGKIDD